MNLVKKLVLTFICSLPVGIAISGYELNSREEVSDIGGDTSTALPENKELDIEEATEEAVDRDQELQKDSEKSLITGEIHSPETEENAESNIIEDTQATKTVEEEEPIEVPPLINLVANTEKPIVSREENEVVEDIKHVEVEEQQLSIKPVPTEPEAEKHPKLPESVELKAEDVKINPSSDQKELNDNELGIDKKIEEPQNKVASEKLTLSPEVKDSDKKQPTETATETVKNKEKIQSQEAPKFNKEKETSISENDTKEKSKVPADLDVKKPSPILPKAAKPVTQIYSSQELEMRKLIGEGPITKQKLDIGLSKLRKGNMSFRHRLTYAFMMKFKNKIATKT